MTSIVKKERRFRWIDEIRAHFNREWLQLMLLMLSGFLVRVYRLGTYSLWGDEADSIFSGIHNFYFHPPLFGFLVKYWIRWAHTDFSLRLLVTVISVSAIAATWFLAKWIFDDKTSALWAGIFMIFAPSQVYYGRELRMYGLLTLTAALSWLSYLVWMKHGGIFRFCAAVLCGSLVAYTHNYGLIFLACMGLSGFMMRPKRMSLFRLFAFSFGVFLIYVPFLKHLLYYVGRFMGSHFWAEPITWKTPFYLLRFLVAGLEPPYWFASLLVFLGAGLLVIGMRSERSNIRFRRIIVFGLLAPLLIAMTLSMILPNSVLVARYIIFTFVPFAIGMAAGARWLERFRFGLAWPLLLLAGQTWAITLQYRNIFLAPCLELRERDQFRESCDLILRSTQPGDVIATTCMSGTHPVWYYITFRHGAPPTRMIDVDNVYRDHLGIKYNQNDLLKNVYTIADPINVDELLAANDYKRLWLYETQWNAGTSPNDFYYQQRLRCRRWMMARYPLLGEWSFKGVDVRLFNLEYPLKNAQSDQREAIGDESGTP
ncbi:glycosyltransferase family 39 protein [bacterium]|nr:glycosyltransferase family 39 protein [candidate division CSSED10-310 bacterium]